MSSQLDSYNVDIQCPIIGLTGYAGSGKDTLGAVIIDLFGAKRLAFADALKNLASTLNPYFPELSQTYNEVNIDPDAKRKYPCIRDFLVRLGHGARSILGDDIWVRAVERQIQEGCCYVITDVRYPNEVEWIKRRGGVIIRLHRRGVGPANDTEKITINQIKADYEIQNDGSINDLMNILLDISKEHEHREWNMGKEFDDCSKPTKFIMYMLHEKLKHLEQFDPERNLILRFIQTHRSLTISLDGVQSTKLFRFDLHERQLILNNLQWMLTNNTDDDIVAQCHELISMFEVM